MISIRMSSIVYKALAGRGGDIGEIYKDGRGAWHAGQRIKYLALLRLAHA